MKKITYVTMFILSGVWLVSAGIDMANGNDYAGDFGVAIGLFCLGVLLKKNVF